MVQDGKVSIHSISQVIFIHGFGLNSSQDYLTKWNNAIETMCKQNMKLDCKNIIDYVVQEGSNLKPVIKMKQLHSLVIRHMYLKRLQYSLLA